MINLSVTNIIALIIIVAIIFWRVKVCAKRGFAKEISNLISTVVAFIAFKLLADGVSAFVEYRFGKIAYSIAMLALVFLVYRIVKLILMALKLFSKLPVVNLLDKVLGIVAGLIEAVLLIMLLLDLTKNWFGIG